MRRMSGRYFIASFLGACAVLALASSPAYADAGIPMIACVAPGLCLLLPLVMLVEGLIALVVLRKGVWMAVKVSALANVFSTLVGIPLRWLVTSTLGPVAYQFGDSINWRTPSHGRMVWESGTLLQKLCVTIFYAPVVLDPDSVRTGWIWLSWGIVLVPLFLLSVWTERWVALELLGKDGKQQATRWAWIANAVSYAAIFVALASICASTWWFLDLR